jgi:hypothetical protein
VNEGYGRNAIFKRPYPSKGEGGTEESSRGGAVGSASDS